MSSPNEPQTSPTPEAIKVLYWGCASSGKTTSFDTLYKLTVSKYPNEFVPIGELKKIDMESGATLYFDRGTLQSKRNNDLKYHVYTVAGQIKFSKIRQKVLQNTKGIIFVFDAQRDRLDDNIWSLKELKSLIGTKLIKNIPLIVTVNKQDLPNTFKTSEIEEILLQEGLMFKHGHKLCLWNPMIYETIALYDQAKNIYESFNELVRRTVMYLHFGDGGAPDLKLPTLPAEAPSI